MLRCNLGWEWCARMNGWSDERVGGFVSVRSSSRITFWGIGWPIGFSGSAGWGFHGVVRV